MPLFVCSSCGAHLESEEDWITHMKTCKAIARDPLLQERAKTHGDFTTNAEVSQALKKIFRGNLNEHVHVRHEEALDMIALKLSRILSGQADFKDHWDDIAGYAKLAAEVCTK